ncbi:hypothetical protein L209DRAFT_751717 [Thermothelomyces heterothallicus CBS 203.75]
MSAAGTLAGLRPYLIRFESPYLINLLLRIELCALIAARHVPPPGDGELIRGHNTSKSGNVRGRRIDPQ